MILSVYGQLREICRGLTSLHALSTGTQNIDKRIPRTIRDSMELCKAVGYRYLWVDCLCIVQDDEAEKERLIHGMNHVYENLSLTLIAVSGEDANAGLAGITGRPSLTCKRQYNIEIPDASVSISIAPVSLEEQIRKSQWNTRVWTLQEQSLSERRLYFTPEEVFFDCAHGSKREGYAIEDFEDCVARSGSPFWGRSRSSAIEVPLVSVSSRGSKNLWTNDQYAAVVSNYSRRILSYPDDIFNAFFGIFHRCTSAQPSPRSMVAVQGLNSASFAKSLVWYIAKHDGNHIKRREMAHGTKLASWSWASWAAPVDFVCILSSSFPAPSGQNYHWPPPSTFYFVTEWSLVSRDSDRTSRFTILQNQQRFSDAVFSGLDVLLPSRVLAMLSSKPSLHNLNDEISSLTFVAPCITPSPHYRLTVDNRFSDGGHLLIIPGLRNGFNEYFSIIKFDCDDHEFTDLVLILFDFCYVALCVRTEGDISRRVGVAQLERSKSQWEEAVETGRLKVQWKQVCLV